MRDKGQHPVIGLVTRLALRGGREGFVRLALTAAGVALGTTLLLVAAAVEPAIRAQQARTAWQHSGDGPPDAHGRDPLRWLLIEDAVDGKSITLLRVAATGPSTPIPLGLPHVPRPGEVYVSPRLAAQIDDLPPDRLAARYPRAPSGMIGDEYLAGPDDLVAVVGMAPEELDGPGVRDVDEIVTAAPAFAFSDMLRIVVAIGAVGLLLPVLVFVAASTRIGAARREQKLAALRLAGATPRLTNLVAAVESGAAAAGGVVIGAVAFVACRPLAAGIELDGHAPFVNDIRVAPWLLATIVLGVPLLAIAAAMVSLRRLHVSPLGVAHRAPRPRPSARRLLPFAVGTLGFIGSMQLAAGSAGGAMLVPVVVTFGLSIYGIVAAGPWLTVLTARLLSRTHGTAASLLAGRRLEADPAGGFRAVSGTVLAVFVASVFSGIIPAMQDDNVRSDDGVATPTMLSAWFLGDVSSDAARRALAAAEAAGGRGGVLLHVDPDPDRPLVDPEAGRRHSVLATCETIDVLGLPGGCPPGGTAWLDTEATEAPIERAPYTAARADAIPVDAVLVETDGTPAATDRIRTAIAATIPTATTGLGAEADASANQRLTQLRRATNLALAVTLVVAGCSLAVAVAAGIVERRRPFALLRLAGMQLTELRRVAFLEAAAPLVLIALGTSVIGLATAAAVIEVVTDLAFTPPSIGYWLSLFGSVAVAVCIASATLPLLGRTTAPEAIRFE